MPDPIAPSPTPPEPTPSPTPSPTPTPDPNATPEAKAKALFDAKTPEEKAAEEKAAGEKKAAEDKAKAESEKDLITLDKITLPEGFTIDKDNPLVGEFLKIANDKTLDAKTRTEGMVGLYAKAVDQIAEQNLKSWVALNEKWQDELIKQHGGRPALDEKLSKIGGLIEAYDKDMRAKLPAGAPAKDYGKGLREAATLTGAGNNPENVNFLIWVADQLSEGAPLSGTPAGGEKSRAEKLFGR